MGRVFSVLVREVKNYNVETRAHKVISKESRPPSQTYPSTFKDMQAAKDRGIALADMAKKDDKLDGYLKNIYVLSGDQIEQTTSGKTERLLPIDRVKDWSDLEYGYVEPSEIPSGKLSVKTTLELLSKHNDNSSVWTTDKLATHYKITTKLVEQLVDRYQVFQLHLPDESQLKSQNLTLEARVRLQKIVHNIRQITLVDEKEKISKDIVTGEIKST